MSDILELQDVIRKLHGVESVHIRSVDIKEVFRGQAVWDGTVEVFDLKGHPNYTRIYACSHNTDDAALPRRHVTVLHRDFINSPQDAVKAAIVQEFRNLDSVHES